MLKEVVHIWRRIINYVFSMQNKDKKEKVEKAQ